MPGPREDTALSDRCIRVSHAVCIHLMTLLISASVSSAICWCWGESTSNSVVRWVKSASGCRVTWCAVLSSGRLPAPQLFLSLRLPAQVQRARCNAQRWCRQPRRQHWWGMWVDPFIQSTVVQLRGWWQNFVVLLCTAGDANVFC